MTASPVTRHNLRRQTALRLAEPVRVRVTAGTLWLTLGRDVTAPTPLVVTSAPPRSAQLPPVRRAACGIARTVSPRRTSIAGARRRASARVDSCPT